MIDQKLAMAAVGISLVAACGSPQAGEWSLSATPRLSINFLSLEGEISDGPLGLSLDTSTIPTAGLTVGVSNSDWGGTELLATMLYGEGERDIRATAKTPAGILRAEGASDDEVLDIEVLMRRPFGRTGAFWTGGVQYRRIESALAIDDGPPLFDGKDHSDASTTVVMGKFGIGAAFPLRGFERSRLFGNILVGLGVTESESGGLTDNGHATAVDVNMGYQYLATDRISLALRYRVQAVRLFSQGQLPNDWSYIHGPELNVGYRF